MQMEERVEAELDMVVSKRAEAAEGVVVLTLALRASGQLPAWEPGAHVDLVLGPDLIRQYSLSGSPSNRTEWEIGVLLEREGRGGSRYIFDELNEGSVVSVRGPRNHFPFAAATSYLFIAGGIGITPIRPMIQAAESAGSDWRLLYGGRTANSMAFVKDLQNQYGEKVSIQPHDECGFLDLESFLKQPPSNVLTYCCGPEPLLKAVEAKCADWPSASLRVERFAPKNAGEVFVNTEFEVELKRSAITLAVPADQSILSVVENEGIFVVSSCSEGTCGSCETTVLAGLPDHRDSVLSDIDKTTNQSMMICVSRCLGSQLVLDI